MSILKNKHLMAASLVTPVLALLGYFAVNAWVGETPHKAEEGASYQLVEMPNCRYDSGYCGLKNGDFELKFSHQWRQGGNLLLTLKSAFPLEGVKLALVEDENDDQAPLNMKALGVEGTEWTIEVRPVNPESNRLRLVASSGGSLYFGDAALKFTTADQ